MTAVAGPGRGSTRVRGALPWLLVIMGLLVVAVVAGAPSNPAGEALDPASTSGTGTKALVEVLESFDATVDTASSEPSDDTDVAVLFVDTLDEAHTQSLDAWVRAGGTLVVADPFSSLSPQVDGPTGAFGVAPPLDAQTCAVPALQDAVRIDPGASVLFDVESDAVSCFGDGTVAYVVSHAEDDGRVIAVGGTDLFTNAHLDQADNAVVVTRLLVPEAGTRVALLTPGSGDGSSDRSLIDVLNLGVRLALVQLFVGFVVYAWFRARRLGQPVLETQPVEIAGSELVLAVGQLLQQTKRPQHAAYLLRSDVRRRLAERLGLAPDVPIEVLVDAVVGRTHVEPEKVRQALGDGPVADDHALLELAQNLEAVRQEVLHGH